MKVLLHPTYFPTIAHFAAMVQADKVLWEMEDNFEKQTLRSRTYIYAANGPLLLNIPVWHSQKERKKYKSVQMVMDQENWQLNHWKSLQSAYQTSPFFEFYEDELKPLFFEKVDNLMDFNFKCIDTVCDCLQLDLDFQKTESYDKSPIDVLDFRLLVNVKHKFSNALEHYTQVFESKHGFIENLSILDLLFNEGPNSLNYLESQRISF
ncbi:WbqC family protein [Mangrovimonas futianensis]|uniref:WbqC family protein n=1 Tax=Mangrovimonas futianensis TaxID=2895523 RepID=UPI001E5BB3DE|nr:WbqC family protein [Mangrovimonas futianensis]MCF1422227.1 WbqC family protein [Mangrovimonas futianensis]